MAPISWGLYGTHHDSGADAYRAARINDRGYGNEQACDDARGGHARCTKGQTSKKRSHLDTERNDTPLLPAVCSARVL